MRARSRFGSLPALPAGAIAQYAAAAGFSGPDLATAVAIAMAESSGVPDAHNTRGEDSRGLWQIFLTVHPEFAGWNLYDPATNASAAYSVYQAAGYSFSPWTTYTSGAYLQYMNTALAAVQGVSGFAQTFASDGSQPADTSSSTSMSWGLTFAGIGAAALVLKFFLE